ncbi:helix-turn-helix domain-containing protein [Kiloniella sp.]|uniref:helix-turn-helix domain-containing protein n=1 Tax=Kiloniella sp. TaxID=1938587 RepID=UPI003A8E0625
MEKPFKKADRLSALIQRFHICARVQTLGGSVAFAQPSCEEDDQSRDSNGTDFASKRGDAQTGEENIIQLSGDINGMDLKQKRAGICDTGQSVGGANFFVIHSGQIASSAPDFNQMAADIPLLVFYPRGVPEDFKIKPRPAVDPHPDDPSRDNSSRHDSGGEDSDRQSAITLQTTGFVCAVVDTGGEENPIALALPDLVVVRLDQSPPLKAVTDILLEEASAPRCGGRAVIDRLCEIVVIRLLRHLIEAGQTEVGLLAGLADPNISLAIIAMHERPDRNFNLEDLAEISAMSRTHFANSFRKLVGVTPGQYLSNWRLTLARTELAKGMPLKTVAGRIGFSSSAALSRAFTRHYGVSPKREMLRG